MRTEEEIRERLDNYFNELDHISSISYENPTTLKEVIRELQWVLGEENEK